MTAAAAPAAATVAEKAVAAVHETAAAAAMPAASSGSYSDIISKVHGDGILNPDDVVGTTFYIAQNVMIAFTIFFIMERASVPSKWKTSMTVAAMVTAIAAWNYNFMRYTWVATQQSPTVYRYTDWLVTVPLLILEFHVVLKATTKCSENVFWRLLTASLSMLVFGYLGESMLMGSAPAFAVSFISYLYIVYEIFSGECANLSASSGNKAGIECFNTLRFLVGVCWLIYPLGYLVRGMGGEEYVNICYNLADLINKGFFGLAVWAAAKKDRSYLDA